ncbi:hypothetical protein FisN_19Hu043 [Fistulifera solaris]|uniref:Uncharacterized protein n=1 Tax=Fistulifera solaris TaxID=1519565 RepID=A0A1Z5JZY0_FISSO|nr:hypothetical protein FisN_19Hu043 [Fistulifera solaris]|eukprot:GAX19469.1 hypothetical protein FisN_19Hu043 [Fistulifera solaris]
MDERTSRRHRIAVVAKYGQHFGEYGYRLTSTVGYSPVDETGGARQEPLRSDCDLATVRCSVDSIHCPLG